MDTTRIQPVPVNTSDSVLFFDTERKGNKEAMMDYGLAYTFKMCDRRFHKGRVNSILQQKCLSILAKLLEVESFPDDLTIQTYFEWEHIDLIVEVYKNDQCWAAIMIENKVDSSLKYHQVDGYKTVFDSYYNGTESWQIRKHWVIHAGADVPKYFFELCEKNGVKYTDLDKLKEGIEEDTGNTIFDEFWIRDWE